MLVLVLLVVDDRAYYEELLQVSVIVETAPIRYFVHLSIQPRPHNISNHQHAQVLFSAKKKKEEKKKKEDTTYSHFDEW